MSIFKTYFEALSDLAWKAAMDDEMNAFISYYDTWELVSPPMGIQPAECK